MGRQAKKAKTRVYFCQTCAARHSAPTGARCKRSPEEGEKLPDDCVKTRGDSHGEADQAPQDSREPGRADTDFANKDHSGVGGSISETMFSVN